MEFINGEKRTVCKGASLRNKVVDCNAANDVCQPDLRTASECSDPTCFMTLDDMPNLDRHTNCELKLCPFEEHCPKYHIDLSPDKSDKSKMCGEFSIEQSKVHLGTLASQKIELVNTLTNEPIHDQFNEAIWNKTALKNTVNDWKSTRKICDLQPNITYRTEIIIESDITLEENEFATVIQKCTGKYFTIISEGSKCADGNQRIPKSFRCDKEEDCRDGSDENKKVCQGDDNYDILFAALAYFGLGFITFVPALWLLAKEETKTYLGQDDVKMEPFSR